MDTVAKLLDLAGDKFLPVTALASIVVIGFYIWTLSGASAVHSMSRLTSFKRVYELGYSRVRKRDLVTAAVADSVKLHVLLDPRQWFRSNDTAWLNGLQRHFMKRLARHDDVDEFFAAEERDARELSDAMRSVSTNAKLPELDSQARRVADALHKTTDAAMAATNLTQVRMAAGASRRRVAALVVAFLRDEGTLRACQGLGLELLDYVGRGTAMGLLLGVLVPVDVDLLSRVAIGTAIGGGLAILLWQRALVRRFVGGMIELKEGGSPAAKRLHWVAAHPGVSVCCIYGFVYATFGLSIVLSNAASAIL